MNIETAIRDFLTVHKIDNGSAYTLRDYRRITARFAEWLHSTQGVTDTEDLRLTHLREWVSYLQGAPLLCGEGILSDRSVHYYSNVVLIFCRWLEQEGVIEKPITTRFKLPRVAQKFIPTFTPDDVEKLLAACEAECSHKPRLPGLINSVPLSRSESNICFGRV